METNNTFSTENFMTEFISAVKNTFSNRIVFIGLQGSRARNEETENSDIDTIVILDNLSFDDLINYKTAIKNLSYRDKICGFISGKSELLNWEKSELFQFYYDSVPYFGNLDFIKEIITLEDIEHSIKTCACSIYHACCHNTLHEMSYDILNELLKTAVITIQAIVFLRTGKYIKYKTELITYSNEKEKEIINHYLISRNPKGNTLDFNEVSKKLFDFSQNIINR